MAVRRQDALDTRGERSEFRVRELVDFDAELVLHDPANPETVD